MKKSMISGVVLAFVLSATAMSAQATSNSFGGCNPRPWISVPVPDSILVLLSVL